MLQQDISWRKRILLSLPSIHARVDDYFWLVECEISIDQSDYMLNLCPSDDITVAGGKARAGKSLTKV